MMRPTLLLLSALTALFALVGPAAARDRDADRDRDRERPPRTVTFEAQDLSHREARGMGDPVVVDRLKLEQRLDALARELDDMRRELDQPRRRRGRTAARDVRDDLRAAAAELVALRAVVQRAHRVTPVRRHRPEPTPPPEPMQPTEPAQPDEPAEPAEPLPVAIDGAGMSSLMQSVESATFRDDKLRVIRQAAKHHFFTSAQARSLAEKLTFGDDRIEVFVTLYPKVIDPENSHVFYGALVHGSDKEKLEKRLDALSR